MRKIIPEIYVEHCKEALEFYLEIFGGEIRNIQTTDGKERFDNYPGKIMHSELHINEDCVMYFVDVMEGRKQEDQNHILLELSSEEEIEKIYEALRQGGSVGFELQDTFWGALHAVVTDRYGNTWGLNYTERDSEK
jgi:PhnB protein